MECVSDREQKFFRTTEESTTPEETKIKGKIPSWVSGTYLRTGPGCFDLKDNFTVNHWFDGYAVISKFHIKDGKVRFEKKLLNSDAYKRAKAAGKPCISEFGTRAYSDPSKGIMTRIFNSIVPELTDNANISLFTVGQNVFVSGETCFFHDLNLSTLQPRHTYDTNKTFGLHCASAHPLTDETGTTYNIGASMAPTMKYCIVKIPPVNGTKDPKETFKKSKILCSIPSRWNRNHMSYNHSFGLTKNYIIFIEQPYVISLSKILGSVLTKGQAFKEWVDWKPESTNRFYVIDKESGKIVTNTEFYSTEPFFCVHFINCYEDCGQVVVTLSAYGTPDVLDTQWMEKLRGGEVDGDVHRASGQQFIVPIDADLRKTSEGENLVKIPGSKATAFRKGNLLMLTPEAFTQRGLEFPGINKKFIGRKHRFYYASGLTSGGEYKNSMCKIDMKQRKITRWYDNENFVLGEPEFVQNPDVDYTDSANEDVGVLVVPMTDYRLDACDMILFINPKDMKELGRAEFKTQIPPSIHGIFVPSF